MAKTQGAKNKSTGSRFKDWEGRRPDDKHVRITKSMMDDTQFKMMSSSAIVLYLYMKGWAVSRDTVTYSASMASSFMSNKTFIRARNELVEKGFIEHTNAHLTKAKNQAGMYKFSTRWRMAQVNKLHNLKE